MPLFFVPEPIATPKNQEDVYARLAQRRNREVPALGRRIFSITFEKEDKIWTATVGKKLHGITQKGGGVTDSAMVVAIFPGVPYLVFTDDGFAGTRLSSKWENPFMVGDPLKVILFSV